MLMSEGKRVVRALLGDRDEGVFVSQKKKLSVYPVENVQGLKIKFCMEKVKE